MFSSLLLSGVLIDIYALPVIEKPSEYFKEIKLIFFNL